MSTTEQKRNEKCDYKICNHAEPVIREYEENCPRDDYLEPEGFVYLTNLCCPNKASWSQCSNTTIESSYFDKNNERYFENFEQLLKYNSLNIDCQCFWPQISKEACEISDFACSHIVDMMDKYYHVIPNPQDPTDSILNSLQHRAVSSYFIHAFFYSNYYNIFLDISKYTDTSEKHLESSIPKIINDLYKGIDALQLKFISLYSSCLEKHPHPKIYYERGMIHMHRGDSIASLEDIHNFLSSLENIDQKDPFFSDLYLQEGVAYAELGLYDKAVEALTLAIRLNPENREAYFERAAAFFEKGDFESSIIDYIDSKLQPKPIDFKQTNKINLSLGIANGIIDGSTTCFEEFIPSLLSSAYGLSQAMWAFAENPIQVSLEFIDSLSLCFEFIKSTPYLDLIKKNGS